MAHCLLASNQCAYANCGQYFANQYELIAHVEFQHIPLIEEEIKRKQAAAIAAGDERATGVPQNVPLSIISRVFRTAYRPNPIKYEGIKVSFNHYKNRTAKEKLKQQQQQMQQLRAQINPDDDKKVGEIDFDECHPSDPEMRFRCSSAECTKRYKNIYALKVHMKSAHQLILGDNNFSGGQESHPSQPPPDVHQHFSTGSGALVAPPGSASPAAAASIASPSKPHKCTYCSKRYKTPVGLTNHLMQAHQKSTPGPDAPSQEVVNQLISQARAQGQQERMQQQNQAAQPQNPISQTRQLTLPVSVNMNQPNNATIPTSQAPPISHVRSFTVTTTSQPLRLSQNYLPATLSTSTTTTTGQMLMQQRRLQQQQAAQQQQQQQQQYQQVQQHHHQNAPTSHQYAMSPVRIHQQHPQSHHQQQQQQQHGNQYHMAPQSSHQQVVHQQGTSSSSSSSAPSSSSSQMAQNREQ